MSATVAPAPTAADRLIEATLESVHRHGLRQTTVTTVTGLAGLSRGMVRHEFGSKHRMVVVAMARVCDRWLADTEPDPALIGSERVRAIVRAMFAPAVFTPVAIDAWLALSVEARADPELRRLRDIAQQCWVAQLTDAFSASGVAEPDVAALGLMATADGLWLRQRLDEQSMPREVALAAALQVADELLNSVTERGVAGGKTRL